ncbi:hypothetical protein ACFWMR_07745 [Amycolatopsis thailandensis]|uniref:hypothetical protein n=1 Tax=Amycolatopsis thailandensis TaxID=589330 RepID=UPI0036671DCD
MRKRARSLTAFSPLNAEVPEGLGKGAGTDSAVTRDWTDDTRVQTDGSRQDPTAHVPSIGSRVSSI